MFAYFHDDLRGFMNRHITIGKINIPFWMILAVAAVAVILVIVVLWPSDISTTTGDVIPTPTADPNANGGVIIDPTVTPTATPTDFNSDDTGLFGEFKVPVSDYLASLEASTSTSYSNLNITGSMVYRNNSMRKTFFINAECGEMGIDIVTCDDFTKVLQKNYTEEYFNDGYCYGIYFDDPNNILPSGEFTINDDWFEHVIVQAVPETTSKLVVFKCRVPMVFVTVAHNSHQQTTISAYERPLADESVVFLDPYYGGVNDQGGWRSNIAISELNLNIALRTNSLLKNEDCVVYLSRELDECVGVWERVYLAEALGADMYISITFVNSQLDNTLCGTEVIYDSEDDSDQKALNGKILADILLENITTGVGTNSKGTVSMGIAPYRYTDIPAAMAEIAYISNDDDFFKLIKEDFQYNAAVAIKDSVLEALELLD